MKIQALVFLIFFYAKSSQAQSYTEESLSVKSHKYLELDLAYGDEIEIKSWDKSEVKVEAQFTINDGEDDDIFELKKGSSGETLYFELVKENWDKPVIPGNNTLCWKSEIHYTIYIPKGMSLHAKTISAGFTIRSFDGLINLETISGDIDITLREGEGFDFQAKTISGDIYSDLDIEYPKGKDGLRQMVGIDVFGRVNRGGEKLMLKTISGNIFLRRG
ncbi:MAG: hypothetical protein JXR03_15185 [Cyclobacteriaceae bacterium]